MSAEEELWKVEVPEGVFEVELKTLQQWIVDGAVKPGDRVCKGNMRWIEANMAPVLRPIFDGELPDYLTPSKPAEDAAQPDSAAQVSSPGPARNQPPSGKDSPEHQQQRAQTISGFDLSGLHGQASGPEHQKAAPGESPCHFHADRAPAHICRMCHEQFCNDCVKIVGTTKVTICPLCGDLCQPVQRLINAAAAHRSRSAGFGFGDFREAVLYPFRHLGALLFASVAYAFLLLGGFYTAVIGWAILFGCIVHVINHVAVGRMNRSFLPDFSAFDLWEDVIKPFFLGVGVTLVSIGPVIVLSIIVIWSVFGRLNARPPVPVEQTKLSTKDFDELIKSGGDEAKQRDIEQKIQNMDPDRQSLIQLNSMNDGKPEYRTLLQKLQIPMWSLPFLFLACIWAIFYYPMALIVAGYTESFKSTINPLVGLDTMRRMGLTYVKAFLMYLGVEIVAAIALVSIALILAPFDMPFIGNLPAKFVNGALTFFTSMIVACIMGLALYQSADKLGIATE